MTGRLGERECFLQILSFAPLLFAMVLGSFAAFREYQMFRFQCVQQGGKVFFLAFVKDTSPVKIDRLH